MDMENLFNINPTDIKSKLNPINSSTGFLGAQSAIKSDDVEAKILMFTDYVCNRLPARYKRLLTVIDGEYLCGRGRTNGGAIGGEVSFQTGLFPITDLQLFKNFKGHWPSRKAYNALEIETDYSVDAETGLIQLVDPLKQGDTLIAFYSHSAMGKCGMLKQFVINLVVADYAKTLGGNDSKYERFLELENQTYVDLQRLYGDGQQGRASIKMLDDLYLVNETVNDETGGVANLNYNSGMF